MENFSLLKMEIRFEHDVVLVRQRTRQIAELLGFSPQDQTRITTAVSEISRNTFLHADSSQIEFLVKGVNSPQQFLIHIYDRGPGIKNVPNLLAGHEKVGLGITAARRLMDYFHLDSVPGEGTTVLLGKDLPAGSRPVNPQNLARIAASIQNAPQGFLEELRRQNHDLMQALEEVNQHQEKLTQLNRELEDTNRGVLALYTELEERAEQLRQAADLKSRFLSYMSHEFRTPLTAVLNLSRILLDKLDGDLTLEQEKQVTFIHKSAKELAELVNDLLSLAKIEAGKITVNSTEFEVSQLFGTLRGMMRPLETNPAVNLIFEQPENIPFLCTDESKVAQILRNLISNGLKYTFEGEVRVSAHLDTSGLAVIFTVTDTGIGIAPEDQERIFEDFTRLETPLHQRPEGIGLGLALSRRLAKLLGGNLSVKSELGAGSTFTAVIPLIYKDESQAGSTLPPSSQKPVLSDSPDVIKSPLAREGGRRILIIDDEETARYTFKKLLKNTPYTVSEATGGVEGLQRAVEEQPQLIFLDFIMPGLSGLETLQQLKKHPLTQNVPIVMYTGKELKPEERNHLAKNAVTILPKQSTSSEELVTVIRDLLHQTDQSQLSPG